jgi:hypothetical protein
MERLACRQIPGQKPTSRSLSRFGTAVLSEAADHLDKARFNDVSQDVSLGIMKYTDGPRPVMMCLRIAPHLLPAPLPIGKVLAPAQIIDYHQHRYSPVAGPISVSGLRDAAADEFIALIDAAHIERPVVLSTE